MPRGTERHDPAVQVDADPPTHADDHRLANEVGSPFLPVVHDVGCDEIQAPVRAHDRLDARPSAFGTLGLVLLVTFGDFGDLFVDLLPDFIGQADFGETALVEDVHG